MPRPKMGWFKFCLYIRAHKNQTSWNLWDPSLQRNLVPAKTFPGMSLAASGARDRTLQQHVAWSVMCQNGATRCQAGTEHFGYSLDPYVVHIPPRLQGNKRKKSWVKHTTFFACSKAVKTKKNHFLLRFFTCKAYPAAPIALFVASLSWEPYLEPQQSTRH